MLSYIANMQIRGDRAVLDCDGVLVDFDRSFRKVAQDALGRVLQPIPEVYELAQRYQLTKAELDRVWAVMDDHPMGWKNMPVFEGAIEAALQLKAQGLSLHLVTGIPEHLAESRLLNLALHGLELDSIHCVGDGGSPKVEQMKKIAPVMFVDDRLRLLHESMFVPYRVWVDLGHEQNGLQPCEEIIHVKDLRQWVRQWLTLTGKKPLPVEKIQPYEDWETEALMVWEKKVHPLQQLLREKNQQDSTIVNLEASKKMDLGLVKSKGSMYDTHVDRGLPRFANTKGGFRP